MWCIPALTPEFIERMEYVLDLYAKPYNPKEPVLCFDEKSKQLLQDTRPIQRTREGRPLRYDYEYKRCGTRNIFVSVEPKGGYREVTVTLQRKISDFACEIRMLSLIFPAIGTSRNYISCSIISTPTSKHHCIRRF